MARPLHSPSRMRSLPTNHLLLVFAQLVATATVACTQSTSSPEPDLVKPDAAEPDATEPDDAAPVVVLPDAECVGCGCGGGSDSWTATLDGGFDAAADASSLNCAVTCLTPGRTASTGFCALADAAAPATVTCLPDCTGRRPAGLRRGAPRAECVMGAYFASMAQLEAASVPAFRRVARELAKFGASRRLVRAAERAAREEVRHARAARGLARRHGATVPSFEHAAHERRSIEDFAIENAVEGCVREAYGALVATWQAREAADPRVRAHFGRIARDETSHASLALRIDAWVHARLDRTARARVATAVGAARAGLRAAIEREQPDLALARTAGLPRKEVALALASMLEVRLMGTSSES